MIRLISPPFGEQPSYQIASTPNASDPEKAAIPSVGLDNTLEGSAKQDASPKSTNPIISSSKPSLPEEKNNVAKAPSASSNSQSPQAINRDLNRDRKDREQTNKVAIAPESGVADSMNSQRATDTLPITGAIKPSSPTTRPRQLEAPGKDRLSPSTTFLESAPSSAAPPEPSISLPDSRAANDNLAQTNIKVNIKVLQIQSELPSDITSALVRYIQTQQITTSTTGTFTFELKISGDRISNISTDTQGSILKNANAIAELEKAILNWRSPNSTTGKIRLVLQLAP
jgi:hypothetical protein